MEFVLENNGMGNISYFTQNTRLPIIVLVLKMKYKFVRHFYTILITEFSINNSTGNIVLFENIFKL